MGSVIFWLQTCYGKWDVSCVPVDALDESESVNTMLFEDTSFSVARLPAVVLNLLG